MSDDLVDFLRARLDEDEHPARATTGPWKYHYWALKAAAEVYGNHPDYREEWRP